ncbi:hypothetical protein BDY19DRAFT_910728 [Irpex rosettiformis]|uniref:Uncharacterized protein n=1 Tax=Irpex rosettiformis TaxID=378272 RepID=A0ACB8TMN5_9APHY|nr:hypothetical protein BDY19DRAFT_910728 [Irpex rosettiformis]
MAKKKSSASSKAQRPTSKASSRPNPPVVAITPDSAYPLFEEDVDSSVLSGLVPFPIADRSPKLPSIFEYRGQHPSHHIKCNEGRTFVYLLDSSPKGKEYAYALSESLKVLGGCLAGLQGELELFLGDAFLGRPIDKGGDPAFDCLQVLVGILLDKNLTPHLVNLLEHQDGWTHADIAEGIRELEVAREDVLGSRADRVSTGKTAFELDPRAKPMKNGPQCFPLNNMVQQAHQVESLPAALKTVDNTPDAHQIRAHNFVMAVTKLNTIAWDLQGPPSALSAAEAYHDMINGPSLGHMRNFSSASQQMNVANAQRPTDGANSAFGEQQGHFGATHLDLNNASNGWSCGHSLGDTSIRPGCEPGRFHIVGLGIFVQLHYRLQVWFTGLLRHGGTPPLVPNQYPLAGWEKRVFVISYPASGILSGEARHAFASIPYQKTPLYLPPEYTRWILRQLPPESGIQVNANKFIRSVSYLKEDSGSRVHPDDWALAPDSDVQHPFSERHKAVQDAYLKTENDRLIAGIPVMTGNPYSNWDVTAVDYGHRTSNSRGVKHKDQSQQSAGRSKPKLSGPRTKVIMEAHSTWLVPDVLSYDESAVESAQASGSGSGYRGDATTAGVGVQVRPIRSNRLANHYSKHVEGGNRGVEEGGDRDDEGDENEDVEDEDEDEGKGEGEGEDVDEYEDEDEDEDESSEGGDDNEGRKGSGNNDDAEYNGSNHVKLYGLAWMALRMPITRRTMAMRATRGRASWMTDLPMNKTYL